MVKKRTLITIASVILAAFGVLFAGCSQPGGPGGGSVFVPVEDIINVPTTTTVGVQLSLHGTVLPQNATNKTITWSMDSSAYGHIGYVSRNTFFANTAGTVQITATIDNGQGSGREYSKTFTITVNKEGGDPGTGITLNKTELRLMPGDTETLIATVLPENAADKNVTWSAVQAYNVVSVENGIVTARIPGEAVVIATADGQTARCNVLVTARTITVDPIPAQTYTGSALRPPVTVRDGETVLSPDTDYIVSYANNISPGIATVTIYGRSTSGRYYDSRASATFDILMPFAENRIEYYWVDQHGNLATTSGGVTRVAPDTTLTITAQGEGYTVQEWYVDGININHSDSAYAFSSAILGNHTIDLFVEKDGKLYSTSITVSVMVYTVSFSLNGGTGIIPPAQTVPYGSSITLPSESGLSRTGYFLSGWSVSGAGTYNAGASYTPAGAASSITVSANWTPVTALTIGNRWTAGNILSDTREQWFRFTANAAIQYIHAGFTVASTLTDLYVQVYDSSLNEVGMRSNLWNTGNKYISRNNLTVGQVYYIKVTPFVSSDSGTYRIGVTTSSSAPTLPPL